MGCAESKAAEVETPTTIPPGARAAPQRLTQTLSAYPVCNDDPALAHTPAHQQEMMGNWLLFLPPAAVSEFELEPNMNADTGLAKNLWCGRVCNFRKIRWLQYCKARSYSLEISAQRKTALEAHFANAANAKLLVKTQAMLKGACARLRAKPIFLNDLAGLSIRGIVSYVHGSGGMGWANPRLCRSAFMGAHATPAKLAPSGARSNAMLAVCANAGFVVFAPDHMSSDEWRSKELKPLLNSSVDTGYWQHNLFYGSKKEVGEGEECVHGSPTRIGSTLPAARVVLLACVRSLWFSTSVDGVRGDPGYYKALYEKIYQVRSAEIHYLLKRLPKIAQAMGVVLFGTSEGAMTVHRFDDAKYGGLITGRIINAFGCEYCCTAARTQTLACRMRSERPAFGSLVRQTSRPRARRRSSAARRACPPSTSSARATSTLARRPMTSSRTCAATRR